jgi:nuclear pore complex protein Nup205
MAEPSTLDALQAFHQEILSLHEGRVEGVEVFENEYLVQTFEQELARVWNRPPQSEASRNTVKTGLWHHLEVLSMIKAETLQARSQPTVKNFQSTRNFNKLP